jgi:hypothetical protein
MGIQPLMAAEGIRPSNGSFSISVRAATASRDIIRQSARICRHANRVIVPLVLLRHDNHVAFIQQSAAGRLCLNGYVSNPVPRSESRFVRVELNAVEIDAFVEWGYLEPKDREDICAIEQAANAFDSGRPEIAGRPGIAVKVRKV